MQFTVTWHWLVALWNLVAAYWPIIGGILGVVFGPKVLDGYEAKYPWLSPIVVFLEHCRGKQDVTPAALRGVNADGKGGTTLEVPKAEVTAVAGAAVSGKLPAAAGL
jgi:hypothetical protein